MYMQGTEFVVFTECKKATSIHQLYQSLNLLSEIDQFVSNQALYSIEIIEGVELQFRPL